MTNIRDSAVAAAATSQELWKIAGEKDIKPNKNIVVPIQIVIKELNDALPPKIIFDSDLKDDDLGISTCVYL